MPFKSLDDISRDKEEREREELKKNISNDINDVFGNIMSKRKDDKIKKKKARPLWRKVLMFFLGLGFFLLAINFVLANFWLLRFFLKSLFNINIA